MSRHFHKGRTLNKISIERRRLGGWFLASTIGGFISPPTWATTQVASARLWPSQEYTRLILEAPEAVAHQLLTVKNPDRLVLDLDGIDFSPALEQLSHRPLAGDPFIQAIRIGRYKPGVVRLVLDLKAQVNPQLFALKPVGEYGHRVVLDLYPLIPPDPLMALLEEERAADARESKATGGNPTVPGNRRQTIEGKRKIIIAIDPGHGGEDPGAIGRRGTYEKHVTLAIAKKLKAMIDDQSGMRATLTRDDDYFVPLNVRVQKARRVQADLFISIHADAFSTPTARGSSVFALSEHGATSAAARWLAQRENAADLIGGVNLDVNDPVLARTLLDLSQTAQINDSLRVGRSVLEGIGSINALHKASVEQAGFAVLKAPDIPSILVETAFISNPEEELRLRNTKHQREFANSILVGVKRYFALNPALARANVTG